ncbi:DUF1287 domain-containing protein [Gammaproteobacteria bacterium 42_54_T18]|nr:DUF1287 domain-containing protein [Gammaproteobacteria bacterium 42_54_T18]
MKYILIIIFSFFTFDVIASSDLESAAIARTSESITYDGSYFQIPYPNGDVPSNIGVCTDVIIRSYRKLGIDLQKRLHEDIKANYSSYPSKRIWGLSKPDTNIDHRRVPNLRVFFSRHGSKLPITSLGADYKVGELVTWMLPGNLPHIGIVTSKKSKDGKRPLIVHNIGRGPMLEDMLFDFKITGHYKYVDKT